MSRSNRNQIYIKRTEGILYLEFFLLSVLLAYISVPVLKVPGAIGIVVFIASFFTIKYLFFNSFIFRWIIIITMSFVWGYFAFIITEAVSNENINAWIIGVLTYFILVWRHLIEYEFDSTAVKHIFRYFGDNN